MFSKVRPSARRAGVVRAVRPAFTLIELLVVIAIIAILLTAVVTVGGWAVRKGQSKNTESVLRIVAEACEQFADKKPLSAIRQASSGGSTLSYVGRYGDPKTGRAYPPDELEPFTRLGLPGSRPNPPAGNSLVPGGGLVVPDPGGGYPELLFYRDGNPRPEMEHRDMLAMVVAIELFCEEATATLDHIPSRNRIAPPTGDDRQPIHFLDRNANGRFDADDEPIRWVVDDWGHPIGYMAQRDYRVNGSSVPSSNRMSGWSWNEVSTRLVKLNGGAPVIFSWGPDGDEQLTSAAQSAGSAANLGADLMGTDGSVKDVIDNPMNLDNVYANPALSAALTRGKP